jgi:hypothetical protein
MAGGSHELPPFRSFCAAFKTNKVGAMIEKTAREDIPVRAKINCPGLFLSMDPSMGLIPIRPPPGNQAGSGESDGRHSAGGVNISDNSVEGAA